MPFSQKGLFAYRVPLVLRTASPRRLVHECIFREIPGDHRLILVHALSDAFGREFAVLLRETEYPWLNLKHNEWGTQWQSG